MLISFIIAAFIIALCIFINFRTIKAVKALSGDPNNSFSLVNRPESDDFRQAVYDTDKFALQHDFMPNKLLKFELPNTTLDVATWHNKKDARSLILCLNKGKPEYDIITHFSDKTRLSTTNQADSHFLPMGEKRHIQNFVHIKLHQLMGEHIASENYLCEHHDLAQGIEADEAFNNITSEFKEHMTQIQEKNFWKLKGAYWYLWRRNMFANTSVKTLHKFN